MYLAASDVRPVTSSHTKALRVFPESAQAIADGIKFVNAHISNDESTSRIPLPNPPNPDNFSWATHEV